MRRSKIKIDAKDSVKRMKIKPPWNRYRSLLVKISKYLEVNKDAFKIFFYRTTPTSSLDHEVSESLSKLEQQEIVCVDKLDILTGSFEVEGEFTLLRSIKTFNLWVKTIHFLLADHREGIRLFKQLSLLVLYINVSSSK